MTEATLAQPVSARRALIRVLDAIGDLTLITRQGKRPTESEELAELRRFEDLALRVMEDMSSDELVRFRRHLQVLASE